MKKVFSAVCLILCLLGTQASYAEKLRFGVEGAYPPFSLIDTQGELQGFDIDIAKALCHAINVECVLVQNDFDGLIPALLAKKFDAIIASVSITEERKKSVDFTKKYYNTPARFVRKKDSGIEATAEGIKGKVVGVQRATTHDKYLTDNYDTTIDIKRYVTLDDAYLDLQAGRIDLLLADSIPLADGFLNKPDGKAYEFTGEPITDPKWFGEGVGIAVRKGDNELREKLNQAIAKIRADGTYKTIQDKYFQFDVYGDE
ncbi:ABC transporter substrate-binding protein [Beggiatoa leptomitoformis]|uniref:Transporter substrate-binding domain-containing protein n=1 Tax=Beggiatoa leptomitoformis TaxID=288004 RepID=A0A2N9YAV8_9GAMM|nr:ABC transporter substrate-binding protein [Beggiatoa leptomitoformis]ALG67041.1 transporter substrate-binding domain-containing protein [Beggiatoa leptomitoformis]AUI67580.1 transporter substrate-binding domain-containing protein [Beggiatoa leptomitoformis]